MIDPFLEPTIDSLNDGARWWDVQLESQGKSMITFYPNGYPLWTPFDGHFANMHNACMALLELPKLVSFSTVQMCLLMETRVKDYDVIRIFNCENDVIDIVNNHDGTWSCDRTDRVLRDGNDFYRLWREGEFDRG